MLSLVAAVTVGVVWAAGSGTLTFDGRANLLGADVIFIDAGAAIRYGDGSAEGSNKDLAGCITNGGKTLSYVTSSEAVEFGILTAGDAMVIYYWLENLGVSDALFNGLNLKLTDPNGYSVSSTVGGHVENSVMRVSSHHAPGAPLLIAGSTADPLNVYVRWILIEWKAGTDYTTESDDTDVAYGPAKFYAPDAWKIEMTIDWTVML